MFDGKDTSYNVRWLLFCISYLSNFGEPNFTNYVDIVLEGKGHTTTQIQSDCSKEVWNKTP